MMKAMEESVGMAHPGEILAEEFLKPMGLSQNRLAMELRVPAKRINALVHGRTSITPDTALRLAKRFKMSPQFWMNLQQRYDLRRVERTLAAELELIHSVA